MSDPLRSLGEYEHFVHSLMQEFPAVRGSTVIFVRRGATLARVGGELQFDLGLRLVIRQRLLFHRLPGVIDEYGYEVWKGDEKLYWYDSQPHPGDSTLQSTHPHHKHVPPDIKHHRIPAPDMSFTRPNLPVLIREVEVLMKALSPEGESQQT
jgi:hypothetical protein